MKIQVLANQTLVDIAIKVYGSAEGVFTLAKENGLGVTDKLIPGQILMYSSKNIIAKKIVKRFIDPATLSLGSINTRIFNNTFDSSFG